MHMHANTCNSSLRNRDCITAKDAHQCPSVIACKAVHLAICFGPQSLILHVLIFTHPVGIGEVESDVERGSLHETSYWSIVPLSCITIERNSTNLYKRFSMQKIVQQQQQQINCQLDGCTHAGFRMDRLCECCPESRSSGIVPEGR